MKINNVIERFYNFYFDQDAKDREKIVEFCCKLFFFLRSYHLCDNDTELIKYVIDCANSFFDLEEDIEASCFDSKHFLSSLLTDHDFSSDEVFGIKFAISTFGKISALRVTLKQYYEEYQTKKESSDVYMKHYYEGKMAFIDELCCELDLNIFDSEDF